MRGQIVVTDVTRMREGRVCVAGVLADGEGAGRCVRPTLRSGAMVGARLGAGDATVVQPFAQVELDLQEPRPHPRTPRTGPSTAATGCGAGC